MKRHLRPFNRSDVKGGGGCTPYPLYIRHCAMSGLFEWFLVLGL